MDIIRRYQLALPLSPTPLLLADETGVIRLVNPALLELFGYAEQELVGEMVELLLPEALRPRHPALRDQFFQNPSARRMGSGRDLHAQHRNGQLIPVEVGLDPVSNARTLFVLVSVVDIRERKRLEDRERVALEAAPTAMLMADAAGRIVFTNRLAHETFGYEDRSLIGRRVEDLVPPSVRGHHAALRESFRQHPARRPMGMGRDLEAVRRDGSTFPAEIGLTPLETPDGFFVLFTVQDITVRRAAQAQIVAQNEQLLRLNEEIRSFAHSTSHDLKAPLASMRGLLQCLREDLEAGEMKGLPDLIARTEALARNLGQRIESVLDHVRADETVEDVTTVELGRLIQEAWQAVAADDRHGPASLECRLGTVHEITTRPSRLRSVLENLFSNARKYRKPGQELAEVTVKANYEAPHWVVLRVSDRGRGIPESMHHRVFGMFQRFEDDSSEGTGLGLALVCKHVRWLGGEISFSSDAGGTSFLIKLPLVPEDAPA